MLSCGNNFFVWGSCCPTGTGNVPYVLKTLPAEFPRAEPLCGGALYWLGLGLWVAHALKANACRAAAVTSAAHEVPGSGTLTQKGREAKIHAQEARSH